MRLITLDRVYYFYRKNNKNAIMGFGKYCDLARNAGWRII